MTEGNHDHELLSLAAGIVSAHVSRNEVPPDGLPNLIRLVYAALSTVGTTPEVETRPEPAVPVKKSVFPDYIVCLEDGKKRKMLKRHLLAAYGLTPEAYRTRWDLPRDYPMVAPNYASHRSALAKNLRLGRSPEAGANEPVQQVPAAKKRRKAAASA